jgi:hypothetical protein
MNKDYLFDKTGEDAEIEKLENLLQTYRFEQNDAPLLPQKVVVFPDKTQWFNFRIAFAFAACLFVAVMIGFFALKISKKDVLSADNNQKVVPANQEQKTVSEELKPSTEQRKTDSEKFFASSKSVKSVEKQFLPKEKPFRLREKPLNFVSEQINFREKEHKLGKNVQKPKPEIVLTKEEIDAYEQLKLALSITSSKLKIVKEKIDNTEGNNSVIDKKVVTK